MTHPYAEFIQEVEKPARYLGGERNQVRKDWDAVDVRMCLAFPDLYDLGMSHLGTKILYKLLNDHPGILAERAFAPWADMEAQLRAHELPVLSLESARPLADFDVVGFSLQYELTYTNVLLLLDLSKLPLRSVDREDDHPIIIAGGPCATHPEAVAPFIDALLIGDAEEELPEAVLEIGRARRDGHSREQILRRLAVRGGWYVPSLYDVEEEPRTGLQVVTGSPFEDVPDRVVRCLVEDLSAHPFPDDSPVAAAEAVFERMSLEIARGCTEGCRFCQAGMIYRPVRERSPDQIVETLVSAVKKGGYDEASLTCLSTADYTCISPLIKRVARRLKEDGVSLSVSSLRAYGLSEDVLDELRAVKAGGLTFAPEAGTQRMRDVVNKNVSEDDILTSSHRIFARGWDRAKLYFMIGLPSEQHEDILGIIETGRKVREVAEIYLGRNQAKVVCSVSSHVPKPHTPFQWVAFDSLSEIERKQQLLRERAREARVKLRTHDSEGSFVEAVISRGDRRVADVIEEAYHQGARFDGWDGLLRWDVWMAAFASADVEPIRYHQTLPVDVRLPWDHIDVGLADGFLYREYKRSLKDRLSPPCAKPAGEIVHPTNVEDSLSDTRKLVCYHCGVACDLEQMREERVEFLTSLGAMTPTSLDEGAPALPLLEPLQPGQRRSRSRMKPPPRPPQEGSRVRYRVRYSKSGVAVYSGHLDLVRELPRLLRRAGLKLWRSEGFKPKPVMSFGPPLPLGWSSQAELMDLSLSGAMPAEELLERLNDSVPEGLEFLAVRQLSDTDPKLSRRLKALDYSIHLRAGDVEALGGFERLAQEVRLAASGEIQELCWERKEKQRKAPWADVVKSCTLVGASELPAGSNDDVVAAFNVRLSIEGAQPRPTEVLAAVVNGRHFLRQPTVWRSSAWDWDPQHGFIDPMLPPPISGVLEDHGLASLPQLQALAGATVKTA